MPEFSIPENCRQCVLDLHGAAGEAWLRQLPALLADYAERWEITLEAPFPLSYNYVAPATRNDGERVVLKVGFPGAGLRREMEALRLYAGQGAARLLESDREDCIFLLERIEPGTTLNELALQDDEAATRILASAMRSLWRPLPERHPFRSVGEWAQGMGRLDTMFADGAGPLPKEMVAKAKGLFAELMATDDSPVLLHGDLHHLNVLYSDAQGWRVIDPKGMFGHREYEVGPLFYNALPERMTDSEAVALMERRVQVLAEELAAEPERIRGWAYAECVLSAFWSVEDHGDGWQAAIAIAEWVSGGKI